MKEDIRRFEILLNVKHEKNSHELKTSLRIMLFTKMGNSHNEKIDTMNAFRYDLTCNSKPNCWLLERYHNLHDEERGRGEREKEKMPHHDLNNERGGVVHPLRYILLKSQKKTE